MKSSRGKSKSNPTWLLVLGVVVVAVVGGAVFVLMEADTVAPVETAVVSKPQVEDQGVMEVTPVERRRPEEVRLAVPDAHDSIAPQLVAQVEPDAPSGSLSGRTVSPDGQPVAGASLRLYKGNPLISSNFAGTRQLLPTKATSAEDGSFTLLGVPVGKDYVLVAEHDDFARTELPNLRVLRDQETADVELRFEQGAVIEGHVRVAVGGGPVPEARVELYDNLVMAQTRPEDRRPWKVVFTDGAGHYAFQHVSATSLRVRVEAQGFESQSQTISYALEARAQDKTIDFSLNQGLSLPGQVVDANGQAVAGARLEATALTRDYQGNVVAFSDDAGYFLLDGMGAENNYQLRATADGYSGKVVPRVQVSDGHVLVEMDRQFAAEGWVRDYAGKPITEFNLTLMRAPAGREPTVMNDTRDFQDEEGAFVFAGLDPGSYALEARAAEFAPARSESFTISTESGAPSLVISMGRGGTLEGVVYGADGEPVPRAKVVINPNNHVESPILKIFSALAPTAEFVVQGRTNKNGAYRIKNIMPGVYQVAVRHPESAPAILNDVVINDDESGGNSPLDMHLPAGAVIGGRALDSSNQPLAFAEVQLSQTTGFMEAATTDRDGFFLFENLLEGTYTLSLRPEKGRDNQPLNPLIRLMHAQKSRQDVFVAQGQQMRDLELYLSAEVEG